MREFYVVSGYMRSGTSMMMQALIAGGLSGAYNESRDAMNEKFGDKDYKPNAGGFYELERTDYMHDDFPENVPNGNLFKCLFGGITRLPAGRYRVVYMLRDPEEIRQSFEAFFNQKAPKIESYDKLMSRTIGILQMRRDMECTVLQYADVVKNPIAAFQTLKDIGWEIDPKKSASVVDKTQYRFRKELLTPGA